MIKKIVAMMILPIFGKFINSFVFKTSRFELKQKEPNKVSVICTNKQQSRWYMTGTCNSIKTVIS